MKRMITVLTAAVLMLCLSPVAVPAAETDANDGSLLQLEEGKTGSEELEINVAKHRNGATRRVYLAFEPTTNALMSIERHAE